MANSNWLAAAPEGDVPPEREVRWIVAAGNVGNPCLGLACRQGYALSLEEGGNLLRATKGLVSVSAHLPEELLGLIRLSESENPLPQSPTTLRAELWERAIRISDEDNDAAD